VSRGRARPRRPRRRARARPARVGRRSRVRRAAWPHDVEDTGRSLTQAIVEGLIVLAVVILGVVVVVALAD